MTNQPESPSTPPELVASIMTWESAVDDLLALVGSLSDAEWSLPSDLPGWDVRAIVAHVAHLEADLAGLPQPAPVEVVEGGHVKGMLGVYTEAGIVARADWTHAQVADELRAATALRRTSLEEHPPTDPDAVASGFAGLLGWSWRKLLSNRCVDVWTHEQDVRRAIGRPGHLDTAGARHTLHEFADGLSFVWGKRVKAAPGQTVLVELSDGASLIGLPWIAAGIGADGRGVRLVERPADPTVTLSMDTAGYTVLSCGRAGEVPVDVAGDPELGARTRTALALTP